MEERHMTRVRWARHWLTSQGLSPSPAIDGISRVSPWLVVALLTAPLAGAIAAQQAAPKPAPAGPVLVVETVKGTIEIELYPGEAPKTVAHITALAKRNFYNGQRVHRVVPGFVVQFGDPQSRDMTKRDRWGTMGSGRAIGVAEINPKRRHGLGAVAMAHAGDPSKADSQMYITLAPQPRLDGQYTVFGQVISGMDVVQKIAVNDLISTVTVKP
jgi:cyclophilin family peptidyl-prolyl cis-trans isomerase